MKMCVLASGSSGNCIYVGSESTRILIDAGLSGRETMNRLKQIGVSLSDIQAVCLTHEHSDHITGLAVLHTRYGIDLYANAGTIEAIRMDESLDDPPSTLRSKATAEDGSRSPASAGALRAGRPLRRAKEGLTWHVFTTGSVFQIGDMAFDPFAVSHDAYEPVGFIVSSGSIRVGIVTDIGVSTHLVRERLKPCQALIIESNHDEHLLTNARRPWSLKQRIAGRQGHLSNQHAAELVADIAGPRLSHVFLSHLSSDCNRPDLALNTTLKALGRRGQAHVQVKLTFPDRISEVWSSKG